MGARRLACYAGLTLLLLPVQAVLLLLRLPAASLLPVWYHKMCCRLMGIEIQVIGTPSREKPTLFVGNHTSYLDIPILGSLIRGSFIAKSEVADWPGFGFLSKLQRSVYVDRQRGTAAVQRDAITERMEAGDNLILFPEGTSNDGNRVLPFRSALLSVAERRPRGEDLVVQPFSISYVALNGMPAGRSLRPMLAWYGDMELAGHLWRFVQLGKVRVVVEFHAETGVREFGGRKGLTSHCWKTVSDGVQRATGGCWAQLPAAKKAPALPAAGSDGKGPAQG